MVIAEENRPSEKFHEGHLLVDSMIDLRKDSDSDSDADSQTRHLLGLGTD